MSQIVRNKIIAFAPGLLLTASIATVAEAVSKHTTGLSPLLWASVGGITLKSMLSFLDSNGVILQQSKSGIQFSKARLLRLGIVCYGAKLTFQKIVGVGAAGLLADVYTVVSSILIGFPLGRALGLKDTLTSLITTGAAICGCSAVAATQPIVEAEAHEVAAAVGTVVLCGTTAMFLYPFLWKMFSFLADSRLMGIYTGATVHELAGVVAAANAMSPEVASVAVVTKLVRVCMLEPWLVLLFYLRVGRNNTDIATGDKINTEKGKQKGFPWFALGFAAIASINSLVGFGPGVTRFFTFTSSACLATAMAALGLDTDISKIRSLGIRPLVLAAVLWFNLLVVGCLVARFLVRFL